MANINTGKGGKSFNDRELAAKVRTLALDKTFSVLKKGKGKFYEAVLLRLAGSLLPRLNELTGEDGKAIVIEFSEVLAKKHGINSSTNGDSARLT